MTEENKYDLVEQDPQKCFDIMAKHLMDQGEPASDAFGGCWYRQSDKNLKCAVGALIPDDVYHKSMEGCSAEDIMDTSGKYLWPIHSKVSELLMSAQIIHDETEPSDWKALLSDIAKDHELNTTVLEAYE